MSSDLFERLPDRHEIGQEIVDTARRARRLKSLYRLICRIETEQAASSQSPAPQAANSEGGGHE